MRAFEHVDVVSVDEAIDLLRSEEDSKIIAGGTDLLPLMKDRLINPRLLINIKRITGLDQVQRDETGGLQIGPLVTLSKMAENKALRDALPILNNAIQVAASPQLRNVATVAGNLCQRPRCWYYRGSFDCFLTGRGTCRASNGQDRNTSIFGSSECCAVNPSDIAPALMALDASIAIQDAKGCRQIPIAEFFIEPRKDFLSQNILGRDEMIVGIWIPKQPANSRGIYLKAMERKTWSFAQASVAIQLSLVNGRIEDIRIVLGSVAPVPWRAKVAESILRDQSPKTELIERAANAAVEGAQTTGRNAYKVTLIRELVRRGLELAVGG